MPVVAAYGTLAYRLAFQELMKKQKNGSGTQSVHQQLVGTLSTKGFITFGGGTDIINDCDS